jgi:hypothetical protein
MVDDIDNVIGLMKPIVMENVIDKYFIPTSGVYYDFVIIVLLDDKCRKNWNKYYAS